MSSPTAFPAIEKFFSLYKNSASAAGLPAEFETSLLGGFNRKNPASFQIARGLYERAISLVEKDAADKGFGDAVLGLQRALYRELEGILQSAGLEQRHYFLLVVPVADRPLMLANFLASLAEQCRIFRYGAAGTEARKVAVFVIDDSKDPVNSGRIQTIAGEANTSDLPVHYVGLREQSSILKKVPVELRKKLSGLLGNLDGEEHGHKGASVARNISYLYLGARMAEFPNNTLLWFIDSDEEFRVKAKCEEEIRDVPFINYFYWLDRIFSSSEADVLTGKVVGDPPVTPAVMINTFLEDALAFLGSLSTTEPGNTCLFHSDHSFAPFSAEYHDMTALFGYRRSDTPKKYRCSLKGRHTVGECFDDFSERAAGFFSGLHPTRTQLYVHSGDFLSTEQARTVYTGNYVIRRSGLGYFLPFAGLGLRMAGPTLGRILRKRLGRRFVSAGLPLLHKRTLPEKFTDEFRTGIRKEGEWLDLSGEFVRQFWGDVALFSVEGLTPQGYPERIDEAEIAHMVGKTIGKMGELYRHHQAGVSGKVAAIRELLEGADRWWNLKPERSRPVQNLLDFCTVVEKNFGPHSAALARITDQVAEGSMKEKIIRAIASFTEEDRLWDEALKALHHSPGG